MNDVVQTPAPSDMNTLFVVPHSGRDELLSRTLLSITEQVGYTGDIEVAVVSKQDTAAITAVLDRGAVRPIRHYFRQVDELLSIAAQRNLGVQLGDADHLAFIDADVQLAPDWLSSMQQELYAADDRVIVCAVQRCPAAATRLEQIRTDQINVHTDTTAAHLPGTNLFMRRLSFDRIGGFPEHLATCEDYYFTEQATAIGTLWRSTRSGFFHLGEDRHWLPMFRKEIWRGTSNLLSLRGRRIQWRELPSLVVPVWTLLALLAMVWLLVTGPGVAAAAAALALLTPALLYAIRLRRLSGSQVALPGLVLFYLVYFTARGIGFCQGLFRWPLRAARGLNRSAL